MDNKEPWKDFSQAETLKFVFSRDSTLKIGDFEIHGSEKRSKVES